MLVPGPMVPARQGPVRTSCSYSRKSRSLRERLGCRSFFSAFASIWRMRSRVTAKTRPTSSSVRERPSSSPKRSCRTVRSRSLKVPRTSPTPSYLLRWTSTANCRAPDECS